MRIKVSMINELYNLCDERIECLTVGLENALINEEKSKEAYDRAERIQGVIEDMFDKLRKKEAWAEARYGELLLRAVHPKPKEIYIKCLELCDVEVEYD